MAGVATRFRGVLAAGGVALVGPLAAEPIQTPLLSTPLSKPADEPRPAGPATSPAGNLVPVAPTATLPFPSSVPIPVPSTGTPTPPPMPPTPVPPTPAVDFLSLPKPVPVPAVTVPLTRAEGEPKRAEGVAEPAPPANSVQPARPASRTRPEYPLRPTDPGFSVNSTGPAAPAPGPTAPAAAPPAPGVDPMPNHSSAAVMTAALGLALAAAPAAPAQDAGAAALKATVDGIKTDVTAVMDAQNRIKAALYGNESAGLKDGVIDRLRLLDEQVQKLDRKLTSIDAKLDQMMTRTVASSPLTGGAGTPGVPTPMAGPAAVAGPKGTVRLVNEYSVEVSLLLNGKAYRLSAGETKNIDAPAGDYTYELLQSGSQTQPVTSKIKDGETVTLRIH